MRYIYTHSSTEATTGYFSCEPSPLPSLSESLAYLAEHPLDDFMRRHLLSRVSGLPPYELLAALYETWPEGDFPLAVQALLGECLVLKSLGDLVPQAPWQGTQSPASPFEGAGALPDTLNAAQGLPDGEGSSLIFLRWSRLSDREAHRAWGALFEANIRSHRALKAPGENGLAPLYLELHPDFQSDAQPAAATVPSVTFAPGNGPAFTAPFSLSLPELYTLHKNSGCQAAYQRPPSAETAALAEERLTRLGIIAGAEMRHTASLSPVALLRPWNIRLNTRCGRHAHSLEGRATTYGRGLSLADARASCLMEMVERAAMYFSVSESGIEERATRTPLRRAARSELLREGLTALDPNDYPLEVPYEDAPLYWLQGTSSDGAPVFMPAQMVGLFCNLDEIALFDAPGSTGIATGCTMEEAKLAALLEVIERDAEAVTPFARTSCFTLEADEDPLIAALLYDYKARGINVQFQDLTGPLGVPAYKCFVMGPKGGIAAGHGAALSSRKALVSALTETPFPYPDRGPSGPLLRRLPVRRLQDMPDYSLPTPAASLAMLEALLEQNSRPPLYADLTHAELAFPVVRCCIPGLELAADYGTFARVPYRLYSNYLRLFGLFPARSGA